MCRNSQIFSFIDNIVPILDIFRNFTSIRKPRGPVLKRVASSSIPKRYQISSNAQLSKTFSGNVKFFFDLVCQLFKTHLALSKIARYGVHLPEEYVLAVSHVEKKLRIILKSFILTTLPNFVS